MNLAGKNIVVTRPTNQSSELIRLLKEKGAHPLSYPCIEIKSHHDSISKELMKIDYDWIIFTSKNAVTNKFSTHKIAAVGQKTAEYAASFLSKRVDAVPTTFTAASITNSLGNLVGKKVIIPHGNLAKSDLRNALENSGALVTAVEIYQTVKGSGGIDLVAFKKKNPIDVITFTSGSCARFFKERLIEEGGSFDELAHAWVACIGEPTAHEALSLGFGVDVVAKVHTAAGLVDALELSEQ